MSLLRNPIILGVFLVASLGLVMACGESPSATPSVSDSDGSGWHTTIDAALRDQSSGPRVIVVTRAGWSAYERAVYDNPALKPLLDLVPRARVDMFTDTQRFINWGLEGAPALVLVNADGKLLTSLVGARDLSFVKRTIERTREFPLTRAELEARTDLPARLRLAEVLIDQNEYETAALLAGALRSDTAAATDTLTSAAATYLYAYACAELRRSDEARKAAQAYLSTWPNGQDRPAVLWILAVLDLQKDKGRDAENRVREILQGDSGSFYARQAVLAYAMEYLARQKNQLAPAERFLSGVIAESGPWSDDFLMARASLRLTSEAAAPLGLEDYKTVISRQGRLAEEAEERLIMIGAQPGGEGFVAPLILWFQDLVRKPDISDRSKFALVRLYVVSRNFDRGREEARALASGEGPYADDALLLLGALKMEEELDPPGAVTLFQDLVKRFPARETLWPAKYGLARAYFFSGQVAEAKTTMDEVIAWMTGRRFLPDAFALIAGPQAPARAILAQMTDYRSKTEELLKEENGVTVFQELLKGVLAGSKGDTAAATVSFQKVVTEHPASSVADDAYMELAKISLREQRIDDAKKHLERVIASYRNSDQYDEAERFLQIINSNGR